jgi:hypothetical protein
MFSLSTKARHFVRNSFGLCIPSSSGYLFVSESLLKQKKREASKTGETSTFRIAYSQEKKGKSYKPFAVRRVPRLFATAIAGSCIALFHK